MRLYHDIDSIEQVVNLRASSQAYDLISRNYLGREYAAEEATFPHTGILSPDSIFATMKRSEMLRVAEQAKNAVQMRQQEINSNELFLYESSNQLMRHSTEFHRRFTLPFACFIFFFIGAPLGAIIRKGGLGMPVVASVLMFIIYYMIETTGYKMAREGLWEPFAGMWLSSSVLLPVGIFLTYKAAVDAQLFRSEHYMLIWNKLQARAESILKRKV